MMVGLHTCGDLAANTLRIFTAKPEIKAVCSVGCCYHLLSEQFENQEGNSFELNLWLPVCTLRVLYLLINNLLVFVPFQWLI